MSEFRKQPLSNMKNDLTTPPSEASAPQSVPAPSEPQLNLNPIEQSVEAPPTMSTLPLEQPSLIEPAQTLTDASLQMIPPEIVDEGSLDVDTFVGSLLERIDTSKFQYGDKMSFQPETVETDADAQEEGITPFFPDIPVVEPTETPKELPRDLEELMQALLDNEEIVVKPDGTVIIRKHHVSTDEPSDGDSVTHVRPFSHNTFA